VKLSDGTLLSAADVAAALQPLLPSGRQITASGNSVVVLSAAAMPDLLEELASGRFFVYRVQPDGSLMGTGPFFVSETAGGGRGPSSSTIAAGDSNLAASSPGVNKMTHLRFRANEETWSGRPFLDAIEVTLECRRCASFSICNWARPTWSNCLPSWCEGPRRTISVCGLRPGNLLWFAF